MRAPHPSFFPLDGRNGWRTAAARGVAVEAEGALRLAGDPCGPLALDAADGSLGGLTLPRGLAIDGAGSVYLLGAGEPWVKRFDPARGGFAWLPEVGGEGDQPRRLRHPANLAAAGRTLVVADGGNRRVQVFDLEGLALVRLLEAQDRRGRPLSPDAPTAWEPVDVAAHGGAFYLLDRGQGRVYRLDLHGGEPTPVVDEPRARGRWSRIALDREGRIYLLEAGSPLLLLGGTALAGSRLEEASPGPRLQVFGPRGERLGTVSASGEVRSRFAPPALRLDHRGRFCLPPSLAGRCDRRPPASGPPPEAPLDLCPPSAAAGLLFDRQGLPAAVDPTEPFGPRPYQRAGRWTSRALDSRIHRCQWHRVELDLRALPPGTRVTVSTLSGDAERPPEEIEALPEHRWETRFTATGAFGRPSGGPPAGTGSRREFLVQSRQGRYLWLRIDLASDGRTTPAVAGLRVHYPRVSYLDHLPAVYSADEESRWFLERFLAIAQTEWDDLERRVAETPGLFDPRAVPEGSALEYLAGWLDLDLPGAFDARQRRVLLQAAPWIRPRLGTRAGVEATLSAYVESLTGLTAEEQRGYPAVVEGFRQRRRMLLALPGRAELGRGAPLWGASFVGRLQLGTFARAGEARLVSTGEPETDLFGEHAHRFQVFLPAAWVRTAGDERLLRHALETAKPAHTAYDLCLVEPRFRVGYQSTVGLDTVIGACPHARLACRHESDLPPALPPRGRLGYDTVLGDGMPPGRLTPGTAIGSTTTLI